MPLLFFFFMSNSFTEIEEKYSYFRILMGKEGSINTSVLRLFEKHGLDTSKLTEKQITYHMVERVVIDMRSKNSEIFKYEQIEIILNQVKER